MKGRLLNLWLMVAMLISVVFTASCTVPEATDGEGGFDWTIIIFMVVIFAIMYLVLIRPQRKKQKEHQQMMSELKKGDRVVTAGGIYGQVESISEESVVIKIESGATMRVSRSSVALKRDI